MRPTGGIDCHWDAIQVTSPMNMMVTPSFGSQFVPIISSIEKVKRFSEGDWRGWR